MEKREPSRCLVCEFDAQRPGQGAVPMEETEQGPSFAVFADEVVVVLMDDGIDQLHNIRMDQFSRQRPGWLPGRALPR